MKISNSQIQTFQKCNKRFYFEHILKLKPKSYPEAMEKGLFGHEMMEAFFKRMMEGGSYEECVEAISPLLTEKVMFTDKVSVYRHVLAFGAWVFSQPWRPVQVEESCLVPVDSELIDELEFAFTIDIIFEWTMGPKKGRKFALDFKFTGQYWSERELAVAQQLPKYMIYTNKMGVHKISNIGLVMLNTRAAAGASGTGLFQLKWLQAPKIKLETIERENARLMDAVAFAKINWEPEDYLRTVDTFQCKMCIFADDLCPADLEGRETRRYIERNYELNTYFDDNYEKDPVE